ncbi:MAG: hypothetical protein JXA21_22670 [Anaerolineae bacterium]|nr:hypothetical protein [Anaerolineae bacterium]
MMALWNFEWLKMRRRALPWISLGGAGVVFTLALWLLLLALAIAAYHVRQGAWTFSNARLEILGLFKFLYSDGFLSYDKPITSGILDWPNYVTRILVDLLVVFFVAGMPDQGSQREVMRQWVGHGVNRTSYALAQALAMLTWLALAWCVISIVVLLLGTYITESLLVDPIWQAAYSLDIVRLIVGNMLRYFSMGCFVYLVVVLTRKSWMGVLGGMLYLLMLGNLVSSLLDAAGLSHLYRYTPFHANTLVLYPFEMVRGDLLEAFLVFLVWGAVYLALAVLVFNRQDLTQEV